MQPSRAIRWCLVYQAVVYGLGMVLVAGLIPAWGQWYSQSKHHRAQVEALLRGELALSTNPADLEHDLTWSEGGVHQVWGLGVPLWRLPFEAAARLCGAEGFPDRVVLAVALGLAAWALLRALFGGNLAATNGKAAPVLWLAGAALLVLLFPPFINLLHTRFDIYEEAVAYEYLVGLGLIAGLLALAQRPTAGRYWILCGLAGFGGLVRPTLVFHGAAAVMAGAALLWIGHRPRSGEKRGADRWLRNVTVGLGLFVLGGGVLFATNLARFGNGFEFGHKLNVQHLYGSLYATRFDDPYRQEPLPSAARELFGLLFLPKDLKAGHFYAPGKFPGQSATVRWREIGLTTYDLSYLAVILAGWAAGAAAGWRLFRKRCRCRRKEAVGAERKAWSPPHVGAYNSVGFSGGCEIFGLALYSVLASVPLLGFYLRNGVIASRYMLDLMPAFAAALLAAWLAWGHRWQGRRGGRWWLGATAVLCVAWLVWQITVSRSAYGWPRPLTWEEVKERRPRTSEKPVQFPSDGRYTSGPAPGQAGVPYNGAGWNAQTGRLMPCVILFVDDPAFLELELRVEEGRRIPADPDHIRAKVGLETLRRDRVDRTASGWRIRFHGPKQRRYQSGPQPVFLATVPNRHLADYEHTPWRLVQVRWKAGSPSIQMP